MLTALILSAMLMAFLLIVSPEQPRATGDSYCRALVGARALVVLLRVLARLGLDHAVNSAQSFFSPLHGPAACAAPDLSALAQVIAARFSCAEWTSGRSQTCPRSRTQSPRALTVASDGGSRGEGIYLASLGYLKTHSPDAAAHAFKRQATNFFSVSPQTESFADKSTR